LASEVTAERNSRRKMLFARVNDMDVKELLRKRKWKQYPHEQGYGKQPYLRPGEYALYS